MLSKYLVLILSVFLLQSCDEKGLKEALGNKNDGPVNVTEFLDSWERTVETVENMPKSGISISDLTRLSQDSIRMSEKASQSQGINSWSASQTARYLELSARYTRALQRLQVSSSARTPIDSERAELLKKMGF